MHHAQGIAQQVVGSITPTSTLTKAMQWHLLGTWQQVGASHKVSMTGCLAAAVAGPEPPEQHQARGSLYGSCRLLQKGTHRC